MTKLIGLIYPFTKTKLHRALHFALALVTVAGVVSVLLSSLGGWQKAQAVGLVLAAFVANAKIALSKAGAAIDALPIPADDVPTKPLGPGAAAVMLLAGSLLLAGTAQAQQFGGCIRDGSVCFGPSATVTVGQFNLATSKFSGGIVPGIGYGATYAPTQWYATGLAAYLAFTVGQGAPNEAIPSLMFSFANYVRLGAGVSITETAGPVQTQWRLLFGLGSDFGGSPKYVAAQTAGTK